MRPTSTYAPATVLDLIDKCLARDEPVSEEMADRFLAIFSPDEQVLLMDRALQIVTPFTEESPPCPLPIAPSTTA